MRRRVARWLQERIAVRQEQHTHPPSADLGVRVRDVDESEHVIISRGDYLEFISGNDRVGYSVITLSPKVALKLAWFVLWRWWVRGTWLGWKLSAWEWTIDVEKEEVLLERSAKIQRAKHKQLARGNEA